jgi:heptaprenyl diphosphate synthase
VNVVDELRLPGLQPALDRVEEALAGAITAADPFLAEVTSHLVNAGGKRLRPSLVVAAASISGLAGREMDDEVIRGGVAVELVHLGSLYHDDVIDEAEQRRGVESVNARWGNLVAILAGDFLLARASEIAASLGTEVAGLLARTISHLCEGEVSEFRYSFDTSRSESAYMTCIAAKTASLMATSARIGGLMSGANRSSVEALTEYGHALGMAFQIWDDVRDLLSDEDHIGKPAGHDLVEGTYTLPVIRALAVPGAGDDLRAVLGSPLDPPARDKARDLVLSTPAVRASIAEARRWADRADSALDVLREAGRRLDHLDILGRIGHRLIDELEIA